MAQSLVERGAKVLVADLNAEAAKAVSDKINAVHAGATINATADVSDEVQIARLISQAEAVFGPVDLFFANAGIIGAMGLEASEEIWDQTLNVNVLAHIRAARLLVPGWLERGDGYFVSTASAAGLLTQIGSATYSVSKHAAVAFAEWLSVTYGRRGVRVSCLCPMGVNTPLLYEGENSGDPRGVAATRAVVNAGNVLEPTEVAEIVLAAMDEEHFLILPHKNVLDMYRQKGADYDRWLRGMRRYQATLLESPT